MEEKVEIKSDGNDATLEVMNKQLLENQTFLHDENNKLKSELNELNEAINIVNEKYLRSQVNQENKLSEQNEPKKNNEQPTESCNKLLRPKVNFELSDLALHFEDKYNLDNSFETLSSLVGDLRIQPQKIDVTPQPNNVDVLIAEMTKKIEFQERKLQDMENSLRRYRENDEVYVLRDRINDLRQLTNELQLENTKLKLEYEDLKKDLDAQKEERAHTEETLQFHIKLNKQFQADKEQLKTIISETQNLNLRLKKEMIEELNDTNTAKRISIDSEITLQQVSMAYENKRREANEYLRKLEEAQAVIESYENRIQI